MHLSELSLDHKRLDVVDWMHVLHAVHDDRAELLEALVGTHAGHCVALHKDVAVRQQL